MARVLVVEDDNDIREVVRVVLTEEGHTVTTALDGAQALNLLTGSVEPFVALVDFHMPQLSGWRVLQIVAAQPEIAGRHAFIFMTGDLRALGELPEDLSCSGVVSTLIKPFDLDNLTTVVNQAAARLTTHARCLDPAREGTGGRL